MLAPLTLIFLREDYLYKGGVAVAAAVAASFSSYSGLRRKFPIVTSHKRSHSFQRSFLLFSILTVDLHGSPFSGMFYVSLALVSRMPNQLFLLLTSGDARNLKVMSKILPFFVRWQKMRRRVHPRRKQCHQLTISQVRQWFYLIFAILPALGCQGAVELIEEIRQKVPSIDYYQVWTAAELSQFCDNPDRFQESIAAYGSETSSECLIDLCWFTPLRVLRFLVVADLQTFPCRSQCSSIGYGWSERRTSCGAPSHGNRK